jgi:hypothetical protein
MKLYLSLLVLPFLAGCGAGSGEGLDQSGDPLNGIETIPLADNFKSIQSNIFTPSCALSGCHSGPAPQAGMSLEAGKSFSNIVNRSSSEVPSLQRITAGDPDNSYLIRKVEGIASVGVQMPRNAPALSAQKIAVLRSWVSKGALGPTLSSIQQNVFTPICTQCHFGSNPAAGMNQEEGNSFSNLVGVKRSFDPEIRVVAGGADSSFIIDKLENNNLGGSRGDRMPLGGPFLDQDIIDVIRDWINAGAAND